MATVLGQITDSKSFGVSMCVCLCLCVYVCVYLYLCVAHGNVKRKYVVAVALEFMRQVLIMECVVSSISCRLDFEAE